MNGKNISYEYSPSGLRYSKEVDGRKTYFGLMGDSVAYEYNADSSGGLSQKASYLRGNGLISYKGSNEKGYYFKNGHGDIVQTIDTNGNVINDYDYDAFGNQKDKKETDINPFRYCGEYYDEETDNIYLRARYYNTSIGRFINEDPVRDGFNWYVYCAGNPVGFVDPSGLTNYIYYDNSEEAFKKQAESMKETYGEDTNLIAVSDFDTFYEEWNKMGSNDETIEKVVIISHGSDSGIYFGNTDDILDVNKMTNERQIQSILISACNVGNLEKFFNCIEYNKEPQHALSIPYMLLKSFSNIKEITAFNDSIIYNSILKYDIATIDSIVKNIVNDALSFYGFSDKKMGLYGPITFKNESDGNIRVEDAYGYRITGVYK